MNMQKTIIILIVLMFLLVPATSAKNGDYKIPSVVKNLTVNDDASAVITEEIFYEIEGTVNGTYRTIPLSANQTVENISVETPGYYNKLSVEKNDGSTTIRVWLYEDEAKTRKTTDAKVKVIYKYTMTKCVKVYNDIAEVQYMTWGDEWNSRVRNLESNIKIPGSKDNTENWNNPEDKVVSSQWTSDDTLTTKLEKLVAHETFEQRIIMPKSYIKNTTYAQVIDMDAKQLIEQDQQEYSEERKWEGNVSTIFWTIIGLLFLIPVGVYGLYGREPRISYKAKYEYDLPTDESPVQVYAITRGKLSNIGNDALYATILDLIDRKYFKIVLIDTENTIIRQTDKDTSVLKEHEKTVIEYLSSFAEYGDISIGNIGDRQNRKNFIEFRKKWTEQAKEEVSDSYVERYFDDKGTRIFKKVRTMFLLMDIAVLIIIFTRVIDSEYIRTLLGATVPILLILYVIMYFVPKTVTGRWTPEGKEVYKKWKNFEKYIKNYSLINERPPESVQVWGKYLVYATALGCADKATKNMRKYFETYQIPYDSFNDTSAVSFVFYGGFHHVESSFNRLSWTESSGSGSEIGSSGSGGFGGGGGGTF